MIKVTLKDGSVKEFEAGVSVLDIAKSISEGLARNAFCGIINGSPNACSVNNSGQIIQTLTSSYTSAFIVGEYKI